VGAKSADTIGFAFFENPIRFITVAWRARSQPDDPLAATIQGDLVREGFNRKDEADRVEDEAIEELESLLNKA
jgi:hypothetical protein